MTERADFDAGKYTGSFGGSPGGAYGGPGQRWPDGAPWPDSPEPRHAPPPFRPIPGPETLERTVRGTVFALAAVPVAAALWLVLWLLGLPAPVIALLAVPVAARLYTAGSTAGRGAALSGRGARVAAGVTAVAVLASLAGRVVLEQATDLGVWPPGLLFEPAAGDLAAWLALHPGMLADLGSEAGWALLFGALGCGVALRRQPAVSGRRRGPRR
ncbi:hypothetical protein ACTWLI_06395 [Arthrobacter sp. Hor0625]|uniref:hypothetical protein n=1 Tax=Arthrobacter sp. Hor0625 TaxID=3457358 RepID=UPI00403E4F98